MYFTKMHTVKNKIFLLEKSSSAFYNAFFRMIFKCRILIIIMLEVV